MVPLKLFQRLLGHMASAAEATPLGPLHLTGFAIESLAVCFALHRLQELLKDQHIVVRSDNTATVATSTDKVVYVPAVCHNSPVISSYGVRSI